MARRRNWSTKRQRDQARKQRQEEKAKRRAERQAAKETSDHPPEEAGPDDLEDRQEEVHPEESGASREVRPEPPLESLENGGEPEGPPTDAQDSTDRLTQEERNR